MVTIVHNVKGDKTYANVQSVSGVPKGMDRPKTTELSPLLYDDDNPGAWNFLPEWLQKRIEEQVREDAPAGSGGGQQHADLDDDVPF